MEFVPFKKIPRLCRECVISEKIDGTNAQLVIPEDPTQPVLVGSRNRWITPGKSTDNFAFAQFVATNEVALRRLGPGRHFGEWYGVGIGRGYGLSERRWALFNTGKALPEGLPSNVEQVPVLFDGPMHWEMGSDPFQDAVWTMKNKGSVAVRGYMNPEGVVLYHKAAGVYFKYTLDGDAVHAPKHPSPIEHP